MSTRNTLPLPSNPLPKDSARPSGGRGSLRILALPFLFTVLFAAFGALPQVRENQHMLWAFWGAAAALFIWAGVLFFSAARSGRRLSTRFVLRRAHWMQPIMHTSVYLYWGTRFHLVYQSAYLIVAQLVFAYAFDMLLAWSQGDEYELGFGPFPIILSLNLFMWFKPDWFIWQFVMLAAGFAAKRLIRWQKNGRLAHIFNPSSLPLAIASVVLLATGKTDITWGVEIANTLGQPAHMFEFIFLVGLPVQYFFGVTSMTMSATVTAYLLGQIYFLIFGTYFYFGTVPTAAFLGMTLLFTDPSTAPQSELGRIIYGILYGSSVFVLYGVLYALGLPLHYDKLLFVPFLNLGVRAIDRFAALPALAKFDVARFAPTLIGRRRNLAMMSIWGVTFAALLAVHGVGDIHPANRLPFWAKACQQQLRSGCRNLETMENTLCDRGAAWACNEFGIRILQPGRSEPQSAGLGKFKRACELGYEAGCANLQLAAAGPSELRHQAPRLQDYEILIDNRGLPAHRTGLQELQWACEQGWTDACEQLKGVGAVPSAPIEQLEQGCAAGDTLSCQRLGLRYRNGDGVPKDEKRALACTLGLSEGCVRAKPSP